MPAGGDQTPKPASSPQPIDLGKKPTVTNLPVLPPTTLSTTQIPSFLDITRLTSEQWAGAVSAAMEGTRLVYGPMTPQQTQLFESKWAPMFDFPFQEGVDWLNKLNPLLGQFLAIRATMADTAIQFDAAWKEAVTAAAIHDEQGVREALSIAFTEKQMLIGLSKQLDQVVKDILALGDPPNPAYHRRKKQDEHDNAVKQTKEIIRQVAGPAAKEALPSQGRWVMTRAFSNRLIKKGDSIHKLDATVAFAANSATVSVTDKETGKPPDHPASATWKTTWTTPPAFFGKDDSLMELTFTYELTSHKGFGTRPGRRPITRCLVVLDSWKSLPPDTVWRAEWFEEGKAIDLSLLGDSGAERIFWAGRSYETSMGVSGDPSSGPGNPLKYPQDFKETKTSRLNWAFGTGGGDRKSYLGVRTEVDLGGSEGSVILDRIYQYDWDPTGDTLKPIEGGDSDSSVKVSETRPRTPEELAEEIGFHEDNIKIIQANMAKDQEELGRTSDGDRRSELVNRIIVAQANIQAEQDRITTLQTGQIVHTRTTWDEFASAAFIRNCQAEVNEMASRDRLRVGMLRMAGRADPQQAERLRKFVLDHTDPAADSTRLKKLAHIVYNQVQGDLEAKAARSEAEAITADQNLAYVESVKGTCNKAMFVGALLGGHSVMVAYEGAIGFVEGPPSPGDSSPTDPGLGGRVFEGVKRAAAWYNTATFVASEALEGYEKGGYLGGNENKGVWGAAERAGEAFLMAKAFEYFVGKIFGEPPKPGELPHRPTVKESFELAKYRQECEYARSLVEDYKRTFAEYRRIQQFNASAAEMAALEKQLRQKAASMHASFESKLYLKQIHGQGKDAAMLEDFVFRVGQNHEAAREAWLRKMEAMGYDDVRHWKTIEFRNSASAGSPGMDHDMGVWDKGEKFFKDRLRVSTHAMNEDAQKAWEKAYAETTGYSAKQSFENITTSTHVEAYKDLAWIGDESIKHAKVDEILSSWAGQAADVTAVKNYDMFNNLNRLQAVIESGRGMAKDIQTKLLPLLEEGATKFPKSSLRIKGGVDPTTGRRVTGLTDKWSQIRDILKAAADNPVDADRKIRMLTGKSICEVTADLRDVMASFGTAIGK
jgi:hypothetical protein